MDIDNQLLLDCIGMAEHMPEVADPERRWIIVRDEHVLKQLSRDQIVDGSAVVVVTGVASVHAAARMFAKALRARGVQSAPVSDLGKVRELLRIPGELTEMAVFPIGRDTDPERVRAITYFDHFGATYERGPGNPPSFEDGAGAVAVIDIAAPPAVVWALVTDLNLPAHFSTEFVGAEWAGEERGVGARFIGRNQHPALGEWTVDCFVDAYDELSAYGWRTSDFERPGARWRFDLVPRDGATRLRFSYIIGPGPSGTTQAIAANPGKEARVLRRRVGEVYENMQRTLAGIKELAEA